MYIHTLSQNINILINYSTIKNSSADSRKHNIRFIIQINYWTSLIVYNDYSSMQIQLKKQQFHMKIKNQQRAQYFNRVREEKMKQMSRIHQLESMTQHQILNNIYHESSFNVNFDIIYSYIEQHRTSLSTKFTAEIVKIILDSYRCDQSALYCLCLLIDTLQFESWEEVMHNLSQVFSQNVQNSNIYIATIVVYKVFVVCEQKNRFKWLPQFYHNIIQRLGCSQIVLFLFAQVCKFSGMQMEEVLLVRMIESSFELTDTVALQKLCQVMSSVDISQSLSIAIKWVGVHLKQQECNSEQIDIMLNCLYALIIKYSYKIVLANNFILGDLMMIAINGWAGNKSIALRCICNLIIQAQDSEIVYIIQNYSVCQAVALAFQLQLSNEDKFNLLACTSLLFKLDSQCINQFQNYGALKYIEQYSNSPCVKLREMSCLILDQNQSDHL